MERKSNSVNAASVQNLMQPLKIIAPAPKLLVGNIEQSVSHLDLSLNNLMTHDNGNRLKVHVK